MEGLVPLAQANPKAPLQLVGGGPLTKTHQLTNRIIIIRQTMIVGGHLQNHNYNTF